MIPYFNTLIVGSIFLITGITKALSSEQFIYHNYRFGLLPSKIVPQVAVIFIGIESALGVALILHEFSQWLIPSSILLLIGLSILTYWSTSTGRTEDCGCYGGLVIITPQQSILLNLGYIFLLAIAWINLVPNQYTETWQWIFALSIGISASILGWQSRKKPLVDFARLKPGRRWRSRWLKHTPNDLQTETHFIVFLSKTCPYCKRWVPLLNVMNTQKDLPQVLGILAVTPEELEAFRDEQRIRFPLMTMDKLLYNYMVDAVPTAVLIKEGVIVNKWEGELPKEFLDRVKQYYEQMIFRSKEVMLTQNTT